MLENYTCTEFSVLSYNVDGLSDECQFVEKRCREICRQVSKISPDLAFFQETTNETTLLFSELLSPQGYRLVSSQRSVQCPIFTVLFSKHKGRCDRMTFEGAATSFMSRDLLKFELMINKRRCLFLSGHLESLGEYAKIRTAQVEVALDILRSHDGPAVLAGDLNIRAKEADGIFKKLKKKCKEDSEEFKVEDCWESLGRNEENKNTWVCADPALKHIQARYDRMYSNGMFLKPLLFRLIGKEVMKPPVNTTPSDHFGIYTKFSMAAAVGDCNDIGDVISNYFSVSSDHNGDAKAEHVGEDNMPKVGVEKQGVQEGKTSRLLDEKGHMSKRGHEDEDDDLSSRRRIMARAAMNRLGGTRTDTSTDVGICVGSSSSRSDSSNFDFNVNSNSNDSSSGSRKRFIEVDSYYGNSDIPVEDNKNVQSRTQSETIDVLADFYGEKSIPVTRGIPDMTESQSHRSQSENKKKKVKLSSNADSSTDPGSVSRIIAEVISLIDD